MGCFNKKGCFSNMPIVGGDSVVALVGIHDSKGDDNFAPGESFTPISLPIRGTYDDYGSLESIEYAECHNILEDTFNMPIDDIVRMAERCTIGCDDEYPQAKDFLDSIERGRLRDGHEYSLTLIMEHEEIFDKIVSISVSREELEKDFEQDIADSEKLSKITNHFHNIEVVRNYMSFISNYRATEHWKAHSIFNWSYINFDLILYPYRDIVLKYMYEKEFVDFAGMFYGMLELKMLWGVSSTYGQDSPYEKCIDYLDTVRQVMVKKKEEYDLYADYDE